MEVESDDGGGIGNEIPDDSKIHQSKKVKNIADQNHQTDLQAVLQRLIKQ